VTHWPPTLLLIGAGKMGGALAHGWLAAGMPPKSLTIIEPLPSDDLTALVEEWSIRLNPPEISPASVLVLAVKPQNLDETAKRTSAFVDGDTVILSIVAGKTIGNLEKRWPAAHSFVRIMPNTPAAIGRGVSAGYARASTSVQQREWCESLLGAVGDFFWLEEEGEIDAVTAISGSGPAYVFALTEALAGAGAGLGLSAQLAMALARGTVQGAAELMRREPGASPETLRRNVTSPGGTTAAALAVLKANDGIDALMARACAAARNRAAEMAG